MALDHVALVCRSEDSSDRFFKEILGLTKEQPKTVPASLAKQVFSIDKELEVITYRGEGIKFEVFISESGTEPAQRINHVCLECRNIDELLSKCAAAGLSVRRGVKGERTIYFIEDFDSHLYELKGK
jgi:catechol 2,3-dioxygenase-like lactoylglutathione lyase family enzyme